jgi:DNA replication protein
VSQRRTVELSPDGDFEGFPSSGLATAVPNLFFAKVMPEMESVEELIVSVYFFYAQGMVRRRPRFLTRRELEADGALLRTLARLTGGHDGEALARGLAAATARGTLARVALKVGGREEEAYAVNTPPNRRALAQLEPEEVPPEPLPPSEGEALPSIFELYEENVGAITPLIAEELKDAEERYPPEWIRAAFREAVEMNKRNWRYIDRILKRWESEGPDYEEAGRSTQIEWLERRYRSGKGRSSRVRT